MASSANVLQTVCRSCRRSLVRTSSASIQTRYLSASAIKSGSVPTFVDTTNEELNALLSKWQREVFTPSALSQHHRNLVYKKTRQPLLEIDPGVTVTLSDDKSVKLEPLEWFERPNKRKSLNTFARILGQSDDIAVWNNMIKFLEGMRQSKEVVPVETLERITRKANEVGRQGLIRQAAKEVQSTVVQLSIRPVTRELFTGIHNRALAGGLKGEALKTALKEADMLTQLLDREEHCGGKLPQAQPDWKPEHIERYVDMRRDPTVMGVLLELRAAQALEGHNGRDSTGAVTSSASNLLALAGENVESGILERTGHQGRSERLMERWIPIAHGIRQALRVDGLAGGQRDAETKLKMQLKTLLDQIDRAITEERANVKPSKSGRPQRALEMLDMAQK